MNRTPPPMARQDSAGVSGPRAGIIPDAGPTTMTAAPASATMRPISAGVSRKFSGAIAAPTRDAPTITSKNSGLFRSR